MKGGGYLDIGETANKLNKPTRWVKDQICQGKLGGKLVERKWLISSQDVDELLLKHPPNLQVEDVVHNFLSNRPKKKPRQAPGDQTANGQVNGTISVEHLSKPPSRIERMRSEKANRRHLTLTQKIQKLDGEFRELSIRLKAAMSAYQAAVESGKRMKPPTKLLHKWKAASTELQRLVAKAHSMGLTLPTNLHILRVLAQSARTTPQQTMIKNHVVFSKNPEAIKGVDGYAGRDMAGKRYWFAEE